MPRSPKLVKNEILFRGLDEKTKEDHLRLLIHSALIRRLVEVIEDFKIEAQKSSKQDYDSPSWAFRQADKNGEIRAYEKLLEILDHRNQNV